MNGWAAILGQKVLCVHVIRLLHQLTWYWQMQIQIGRIKPWLAWDVEGSRGAVLLDDNRNIIYIKSMSCTFYISRILKLRAEKSWWVPRCCQLSKGWLSFGNECATLYALHFQSIFGDSLHELEQLVDSNDAVALGSSGGKNVVALLAWGTFPCLHHCWDAATQKSKLGWYIDKSISILDSLLIWSDTLHCHCSLFPLWRLGVLVKLATLFLFTWVICHNPKLHTSGLFTMCSRSIWKIMIL